ncbi:MAG: hypothetical protein CK425_07970 [Parachlamydia sp.]|nr:MAG: hypothetical protein CK425_07970 [Parachlamydia sp.]
MSIRVKNSEDFHKFVGEIKRISEANSECLTTKLTSQKGKLDGRVVTFLKVIFSLITRHHFAQTTPHKVAKVLSHFVRDHNVFLIEEDRDILLEALKKLSLKRPEKSASTRAFEKAIRKIKSLPSHERLKKELDDAKASPLFYAILENDLAKARQLILSGAKPDCPNALGDLPFHFAIKVGSFELTKFFFTEATRNTKNAQGYTPLHLASLADDSKIVQFLIEKGADRMISDDQQALPLHLAAFLGNKKSVKLLFSELTKNNQDAQGYTPLRAAVKSGHSTVGKFLLDKGADSTLSDKNGILPLHYAAWSGNLEFVKLLFSENTKNSQSQKGKTPLHVAMESDNPEVVKFLLDKKVDLGLADKVGNLAIHVAIFAKKLPFLELLLAADKTLLNRKGQKGLTPLCKAVKNNQFALAKFLVDQGADQTIPDEEGDLPIHWAAFSNDKKLCELLFSEELKDSKGHNGNTPLHYAVDSGNPQVVKFLLDQKVNFRAVNNDGDLPLHLAAFNGKEALMKLLYTEDTKDTKGFQGETPVICAIMSGKSNIVQFFLDKQVNLMIPGESGNLPIHAAVLTEDIQILKILLEAPSLATFLNASGKKKCTPLCLAAKKSLEEAVKLLLEKGADRSIPDENNDYPLHWAAISKNEELVKLLYMDELRDAPGEDGCTPLLLAVDSERIESVKFLIEKGADRSIPETSGNLPVHSAIEAGNQTLFELVFSDETMNVKGKEGLTPLNLAAKKDQLAMAKFLIEKGADRKISCEANNLPLHYAAAKNLAMVELLADAITLTAAGKDGQTPLMIATEANKQDIVHFLSANGVDK